MSVSNRPQRCYSLSEQFLSFACVLFLLNKVTKAWKYAQKVRWTGVNLSHNRECASIDGSGGLAERGRSK